MRGLTKPSSRKVKPVNLMRKLKLKAMLRNCDYVLAGTVIKQQYYDESKDTEINRLIDRFMANPGFEEALKLIEYNEMMLFYFTESCEGGLYVRKGVEPRRQVAKGETAAVSAESAGRSAAEKVTPFFDAPMGGAEPFDDAAKTRAAQEENPQTEPANERDTGAGAGLAANDKLAEYQKKLKESEEWMEQMIERLSRKNSASRGAVRHARTEEKPEASASSKPEDPPKTKSAYFADEDGTGSSLLKESGETGSSFLTRISEADTALFAGGKGDEPSFYTMREADNPAAAPASSDAPSVKPQTESEPPETGIPAAAGQSDGTSGLRADFRNETDAAQRAGSRTDDELEDLFRDAGADKAMRSLEGQAADTPSKAAQIYSEEAVTENFEVPFSRSSSHRYDDMLEDTLVYDSSRKQQNEAARTRPNFSNVIATLKIDIHTMTQQIEEYRRQLNYYTPNEKQIRGWIRDLEAAVDEFSRAIEVLEGEN